MTPRGTPVVALTVVEPRARLVVALRRLRAAAKARAADSVRRRLQVPALLVVGIAFGLGVWLGRRSFRR